MKFVKRIADTLRTYSDWATIEGRSLLPHRLRAESRGNELLLLARDFPPRVSGGVYRPLSFARYGAAIGWHITVIAAADPPGSASAAGLHLLSKVPSSVTICRLHPVRENPILRLVPRIDGGLRNAFSNAARAIECVPKPPNVILATGPSFDVFVTGFFLARYWRTKLVLDYRDEWSLSPFEFIGSGNANRFWEKRVISRADGVIFTTESMLRYAQQHFPDLASEKSIILPNGWEPEDGLQLAARLRTRNEPNTLRLLFLGHLSLHNYPADLMRDLAAVVSSEPNLRQGLSIRFVGERNAKADAQLKSFPLPEMIDLHPHVAKDKVAQEIGDADVLLLIVNDRMDRYLPGKLFDYMASRKPILVYGSSGEAGELVMRLQAGIAVRSGQPKMLAAAIRELRSKVEDFTCSPNHATWVAAHTREAIAERLFSFLNTL